jgi:hypothetical protein
MSRIIFGIILVLLGGLGPSQAAIWSYESQPFGSCPFSGPVANDEACMYDAGERWTGSLTVDESLLPKNILLNARIELLHYLASSDSEDDENRRSGVTFRVSSAVGFYEVELRKAPRGFAVITGFINSLMDTCCEGNQGGYLALDTDAQGAIKSWNGSSLCGGSCDIFTHGPNSHRWGKEFYDFTGEGQRTSGPGTWTGGPDVVNPATVPLPAALPILLTALAGLAGVARPRRRAADRSNVRDR